MTARPGGVPVTLSHLSPLPRPAHARRFQALTVTGRPRIFPAGWGLSTTILGMVMRVDLIGEFDVECLTLLVKLAWIIGECGVDYRHSQFARPKR